MLVLVTGGSASGKSEYAESRAQLLAKNNGLQGRDQDSGEETPSSLYYIAAMKPFGQEAERRIARHRRLRAGKGFVTLERYTDLGGLCRERPELAGKTVLLECLSNLTANEIFEPEGAGEEKAEKVILEALSVLAQLAGNLIVVTADVFGQRPVSQRDPQNAPQGEMPEAGTDRTDVYLRILGRVNARLAEQADELVEVVYSIPVAHKKE